ncbi:MAG: hypothetical protein ACE5D7_01520 [Fidelibacterota bacterium]
MKFNKLLWMSLTLMIVQILSGKNLTLVERIDPSNHELLDVEIAGNIMMIPGGLGGTAIFNVIDPLSPVQISSISIPEFEYNRAYNWEIKGQVAYGSGRADGMVVISLSSHSNPYIISYLGASDPYSYEHLRANNTTLLVSAHSGGVLFYDITNHHEPEFMSQVTTDNAWATALNGNLAYVADGDAGVSVIDFQDPENPSLLTTVGTSGAAKDVRIQNGRLFVAVGNSGVDLFDINEPEMPQFITNYNTTGFASRIALMGNDRVAVSDWDDLEVLEWNGTALEKVGFKNTGGRVMAAEAIGDVIYSAEWRYLQVFDFGQVNGADIDLSIREINFPFMEDGESDTVTVQLTNNGNNILEFDWTYITHEDFSAETQLDPLVPNHSYLLDVVYTGNNPNASGVYNFQTNDPDEETVGIQLTGNYNGINVGETPPDFSLPIVANGSGMFSLSEQLGKVVVIAFFAPW